MRTLPICKSPNKAVKPRSASLHWTEFKSWLVVLLRKSIPQSHDLNSAVYRGVRQYMKLRLSSFIICTLLSGMPIIISLWVIPNSLLGDFLKLNYACLETSWCIKKLFFDSLMTILVCVAWSLYFIISYKWIRFGFVERKLRIFGAIFGVVSLPYAFPFGMVFVLPAFLLMLYIHFNVPYQEA